MMLKSGNGFTAIELVMGIGVVAILTTVIITTQLMVTKEQMSLQNKLEESIDTNLAERIVFRDLSNIDASYNNLKMKDDAGLGFFDFYPDVPASSLPSQLSRQVSLRLGGKTEFYLLVQDQNAGALMNYDPTAAYDIGPIPKDFNTSASLVFQGLNKNSWIERQRPEFWKKGRLLMLDTPARLRPLKVDGFVDMTIPPRSPVFVGSVNGVQLNIDGTVKAMLNLTDPETGDEITNADEFLRRAPSLGGGQPLIRLRAVRLIKYYLEKENRSGRLVKAANLYKTVYENGEWSEPFLLADNVEEFQMRRDSVLKRMIYFKVKKLQVSGEQTAGL